MTGGRQEETSWGDGTSHSLFWVVISDYVYVYINL